MGSQQWVGEFAEELLNKGAQGDLPNLKGTEAPGQGWDQERPATVQAGSLQMGHGKDRSSAGRPFKTHAGLQTPQRLRTLARTWAQFAALTCQLTSVTTLPEDPWSSLTTAGTRLT